MKMGMGAAGVAWALSAVVSTPLAAQSVVVGVRAGVTSSSVGWSPTPLGDRLEGVQRREALTGGVWLAAPLSDRLGVRGEVMLVGKGFVEATEDETSTLSADYVEVPVLATLALAPRDAGLVPELFFGGWWARETACEAAVQSDALDVSFPCDEVPGDPVLRNKTDWGLAGGAAVKVRMGRRFRGLVDARYSMGLRNIDRSPDISNFDVRHRGLSLTLGLGLDVGR